MDRSVSFRALQTAAACFLATAALSFAQTTTTSGGTTTTDLNSLISQLGGGLIPTSSGTPTTTTQPTTPPPGGGTGGETRPPVTNGALPGANVTLGALQQRAPGLMVAAGLAEATGNLDIPGDANDFEQPSFVKQTLFDMTQAAVNAIQAGIPSLLQSFLTGLGLAGTGGSLPPSAPINVGPPLSNQTTTDSGTVVPVP